MLRDCTDPSTLRTLFGSSMPPTVFRSSSCGRRRERSRLPARSISKAPPSENEAPRRLTARGPSAPAPRRPIARAPSCGGSMIFSQSASDAPSFDTRRLHETHTARTDSSDSQSISRCPTKLEAIGNRRSSGSALGSSRWSRFWLDSGFAAVCARFDLRRSPSHDTAPPISQEEVFERLQASLCLPVNGEKYGCR